MKTLSSEEYRVLRKNHQDKVISASEAIVELLEKEGLTIKQAQEALEGAGSILKNGPVVFTPGYKVQSQQAGL